MTNARQSRRPIHVRTLSITQNVTLDGCVEMITDWFHPQAQGQPDMDDVQEENQRAAARCDAMLLGRRTFEDFRAYWPEQTDDTTGITDELNRLQKYVVSSTMTDPGWQNSTILTGDAVEEARRLKAMDGLEIDVTGSITLCHALLDGGVVDEIRLWTYPVVQGRGRRLFPDGFETDGLELLDARSFRAGIVLTTYAVR
jgi:dihydrofolate reductase